MDQQNFYFFFVSDCLYLNIWAPKSAVENPDSKLPVQVYFHGGAFFLGTNMFRDTDGQVIADRQNIIVVSVAYRFGAFGFVHNKVKKIKSKKNCSILCDILI